MPAPTGKQRFNNYSATAADVLLDAFKRMGEELIPLTQRVMAGEYSTEEGRLADAVRMYELSTAALASLRTRELLLQARALVRHDHE
jgi:hypothetical protein